MKITMVLMTCFIMQLSAATYGQKLTINRQSVPLAVILEEINEKTGYDFFYDADIFDGMPKVSLNVRNAAIDEVLSLCFSDLPFDYTINSKIVTIRKISKGALNVPVQQPGRISGKIIDERGAPLPGASVKIVQTNQAVQSNVDGSYNFTVAPGTYTIEVSYISFQTKRVTEVEVKAGKLTNLTIVMKLATSKLAQVVITGNFKKESTAGLYARQKNEAGISNGISREQIGALPDKSVGETLKRISGVSTNDNRRVVVRGIAERYNLAMMDGATLPSTDVQVRDFEFDIVPSNLVDNVTVSKTATPDMSFGFGGGLVQINTMAIPDNNFTTLNFGYKYINGSTGKDFLGYGRGKNDYLGFNDKSRDHFPDGLLTFGGKSFYNPTSPYSSPTQAELDAGMVAVTPEMIGEQNKRIGGLARLGTRTYKTMPGQNYQFSLGRIYNLKNSRLGFVGSLSYRNEQSIDDISHYERGRWEHLGSPVYDVETGKEKDESTAKQYNFNTSWGALLNLGWSAKNHKLTFRNFLSRSFANQFFRLEGFSNDHPANYGENPDIREYDRPKFIDLLQNRINGEHRFGNFGFDWSVARNKISNLEQDAVDANLALWETMNGKVYRYFPQATTNTGNYTLTRSEYKYEETNLMAEAAVKYNFNVLGQKQLFKTGFQYRDTKGKYNWNILPIGSASSSSNVQYLHIQDWASHLDFSDPLKDIYYYPGGYDANYYEGKNNNQAYYVMLDNRLTNWIRLVWGIRAESYVYEKLKDGASDFYGQATMNNAQKARFVDPATGNLVHRTLDASAEDLKWHYLPSANLTLTPLKDFNIRASYGKSAIRPSLIENSNFSRYNYVYGRMQRNVGVISTLIDHYDLRLEWYPGAGEVISAGYFTKHFKNPVELYLDIFDSSGSIDLFTQNSDYADVRGWEFDLRKSLGFIYPDFKVLGDIYVSGNLTLQTSEVQASTFKYETMGEGKDNYDNGYTYRTKTLLKEKRPLYGQVPVIYNLGLQYAGERLGANIAFNHTGYKTLTVGMLPQYSESERPRNQLDAQLSYKFLKNKKLETRLNMSNLLNSAYRFYNNSTATYKRKPGTENTAMTEWSDIFEWQYGFSNKYEEGYYETSEDGKTKKRIGDTNTFIRKVGTSLSLSVSYSF
ncbi:TonB-dependent receptor [uncultured Chitinophaga sp.]|uniref:TonB-dependent receptor n=1 Tax=uncultured Chitinophaga sp. TaxID=339340 RepID=UPI0025D2EE77|nr:TonB-dependent receptor [uncultured Chitinophaga sp.]